MGRQRDRGGSEGGPSPWSTDDDAVAARLLRIERELAELRSQIGALPWRVRAELERDRSPRSVERPTRTAGRSVGEWLAMGELVGEDPRGEDPRGEDPREGWSEQDRRDELLEWVGQVEGVGPARAERLAAAYADVEELAASTAAQVAEAGRLPDAVAAAVLEHVRE